MDSLNSIKVLLVEDDPGDQKLVRHTLANQEMPYDLHIVGSGEEALDYLQHAKNGDEQSPWPNLILLDLSMPGMGGKECLRHIKADDFLCPIPIVVLTASDAEIDIQQCYKMNAAGYVQKSATPGEFQEVVAKLAQYWFATAFLVKG